MSFDLLATFSPTLSDFVIGLLFTLSSFSFRSLLSDRGFLIKWFDYDWLPVETVFKLQLSTLSEAESMMSYYESGDSIEVPDFMIKRDSSCFILSNRITSLRSSHHEGLSPFTQLSLDHCMIRSNIASNCQFRVN